jgi:DNA polymerase-3 subunit beta
MKVTVERAALLKSLGHVHRVVERRNTIPILSNVLVRAEGAGLRLKATDLDIEVTETIPADVSRPGATTMPAHVIYDIVRKLPEGAQVSLEMGDTGAMQIRSGRSRFTLQTLPESDFPDLAAGDLSCRFQLPAADLKRLIEKTQFAISTEETRYYLNGIFLHTVEANSGAGAMLRAVATDGHRLARVEVPAPQGAEGMPGVIVPRKAVAEIQKLVEDGEASIGVELSPAKIRLTFNGTAESDASARGVVLTSKLIDGTFPDYQRVIPTGNDKRLTVEREDFAKAVDRVSTISSERGRAVKLALGDGRLTLTVNNPDSGNATEELDADYDAAPLDIGFNARYLLDIAAQLEGDTAVFKLADSGSPTVIQDREGAPALYVLMPMRV